MKPLLTFASLVLSLSTFASSPALDSAIQNGPNDEVRDALKIELQDSTLDCKWDVENGPSNTEVKGQFTSLLDNSKTLFTINTAQPAVSISTENGKNDVSTVDFTTTDDFKHLASIYAIRERLTLVIKNTGTITHPKMESVIERKTLISGTCKVTQ